MSWAIGYDAKWKRDVGYGVPAYCDAPGCMAKIDRGLAYVCGGEPYGGERGCGLYFCERNYILDSRTGVMYYWDMNNTSFASLEELMDGLEPLCPVEILQDAKGLLDRDRQAIHFADYRQEQAALILLHAVRHLEKAA